MGAGKANFKHALRGIESCTDPDCEIHRPAVIEDEDYALTACAHFLAGADRMVAYISGDITNELFGERDMRLDFLGAREEDYVERRWKRQ